MMAYLTIRPISVESLIADVQGPERGGTCVFMGTVRQDDNVTSIEYSAYDEMAIGEIERTLAEAHERWPEARVMLQHRLGTIPVGEASIAIVAAALHRDAAFAACRYVIEELNKRQPIWKNVMHADRPAT